MPCLLLMSENHSNLKIFYKVRQGCNIQWKPVLHEPSLSLPLFSQVESPPSNSFIPTPRIFARRYSKHMILWFELFSEIQRWYLALLHIFDTIPAFWHIAGVKSDVCKCITPMVKLEAGKIFKCMWIVQLLLLWLLTGLSSPSNTSSFIKLSRQSFILTSDRCYKYR